jgi:hypothetical protein
VALLHVAHTLLVEVDPRDVEARLREGHPERQPRVAEADDADGRGSLRDPLVEGRFRCEKLAQRTLEVSNLTGKGQIQSRAKLL